MTIGTPRIIVTCALVFTACDSQDEALEEVDLELRSSKSALVDQVRAQIAQHGVTPVAPAPAVSPAIFSLGQALAFDNVLSGNNDISCLTCHHPQVGTDDDRHLPSGIHGAGLGEDRTGGAIIPRNAPALFNLHTYETMFWDSRVAKTNSGYLTPAGAQLTPEMTDVFDAGFGLVAAQAMFPVTSREEMRGEPGENPIADIPDADLTAIWAALMARLGAIPEYRDMFEDAYPGVAFAEMTFAHAANAIAGFEIAAFETRESPWDHFVAGDDGALSKKQLRGAVDFFDSGCGNCHSGPALSDFSHHNTALVQFGPGKGDGPSGTDDFGRFRESGDAADLYAFRTPPLFNVALTGPYGHDGQYADLREMIEHYHEPVDAFEAYDITDHVVEEELWSTIVANAETLIPAISPLLATVDISQKTNKKVRQIEDFMEALTDEGAEQLDWTLPESVPSGLPVDRIDD